MSASYLPPAVPKARPGETNDQFHARCHRWCENILLVWSTHLSIIMYSADLGLHSQPDRTTVHTSHADLEWFLFFVREDPASISEYGPRILSLFYLHADRDWGAKPLRSMPRLRIIS